MTDKAIAIVAGSGAGHAGATGETLTLAFAERTIGRGLFATSTGRQIATDFVPQVRVRPGDLVELADGAKLTIIPATEDLVSVKGADLLRAVWQLGNRRAPCQTGDGTVTILPEPALEASLRHLDVVLSPVRAKFVPDCVGQGTNGGFSVHHHGTSHPKSGQDNDDDGFANDTDATRI